jgi:predicted NUDIX family NTP pyrophosphohydrolase
MKKLSAGILIYRKTQKSVEVLLAHPGGPFYAKKDDGVWSIPKGEYEENEEPFEAAKREFKEEIGQDAPDGNYSEIGEARLSSKVIKAWAVEGDVDVSTIKSNNFETEWPPKSGQKQEFPEIDKADWFDLSQAIKKVSKGQVIFIERLAEKLNIKIEDTVPEEPEEPKQQQLL